DTRAFHCFRARSRGHGRGGAGRGTRQAPERAGGETPVRALRPIPHWIIEGLIMSKVPADLKYTKSHEWVRAPADGTVEVGITDHAQHALGDLVFVEVPEAGRAVKAGEPCAAGESVEAASDVYAPLAGELTGAIGVARIEDLFDEIPQGLRIKSLAGVPTALNEMEIGRLMSARARADGAPLSFIGAGAYEHHIPAAVWGITTRGEFYSAYTPYQ